MKKFVIPLIVSLAAVIGIVVGNLLAERSQDQVLDRPQITIEGKIDALLNLIDQMYVDSINRENLIEDVIPEILSNLDPHSVYIPADNLQMVNDDLESSFSGIGVQFNIQKDTVMIVSVISGGPSEKLGILPGDRIVKVNDTLFVGKQISNDVVMKKLRGPKGTEVKVGIKRHSSKELLSFNIKRGDIPVNSVDAAYLMEPAVGYIKVSKFGVSTYDEFYEALVNLRAKGASSYVIDLRGNSGGYLESVIMMVNEFLKKGDLIVYTEGKSEKRREAVADGSGSFQNIPMAVLIDEWSASASEIFAGAIQDNDRGTIAGRRSFGKGLVQQQIPLRDGSAIRLTIARYYTPAGRCIQKPYSDKNGYDQEILNRYLSGEIDGNDSIHAQQDTVQYHTKNGRVVYGGGGITPDIFIARDTIGVTSYYTKLANSGVLYDFAFRYVDDHREMLKKYKNYKLLEAYLSTQNLPTKLAEFADKNGVRMNPHMLQKSRTLIENRVMAFITRNVFGDEGFYPIYNEHDIVIDTAVQELSKQKAEL